MWGPQCGCSGPCGCGSNWVCLPVPPTPPPAPMPPAAINGPIRGDTSGNAALPGNVGEFIQRSVTGSVTVAANALVTTQVTPLTLAPGDWDLSAQLTVSLLFSGADFVLNPTIPGASSNMYNSIILPAVVHQLTTASLTSQRTQLITASAATILQFNIDLTNNTAASVSGNYTFTINARRMR